MPDKVTTAIEICGAALIVAGIALVWVPAAVMAAGASLLVLSAWISR
jgi:hypothetical protein